MEAIIGSLNHLLVEIVELAVLLFKYIGVITALVTGIQAVINCLKKDKRTRLLLGEGLALSLGFLLIGEVLETAVAASLQQAAIVASIFVLRACMSVLIHWEGVHEREELCEGSHHE